MLESEQDVQVGCRGCRTPLISSFCELVNSGIKFTDATYQENNCCQCDLTFKNLLPALFLRSTPFWSCTPASADHSWNFVYRCKSTSSWFSLPRLQFHRELCRLSLKVFPHASSLIQLDTLPNFFSILNREFRKKEKLAAELGTRRPYLKRSLFTWGYDNRLEKLWQFQKCLYKAFVQAWLCISKPKQKYIFFFHRDNKYC